MYRVSIGMTTGMSQSATSWIAQNAKRLGVDGIWIGEDIDRGQDITILTAATAAVTRDLTVGTGIVPIAVTDVVRLARQAVTLQQLTDGRFILGLGLGGVQDLSERGIEIRRPVTTMRGYVEALRLLWSGEPVTVRGELFDIANRTLDIKKAVSIPIALGVRGEQMLRLSGEIAEVVILSGPMEYLANAARTVDTAAEKAGRGSTVRKVVWLPIIPEFSGVDEGLADRVVATIVADTPERILRELSVPYERLERIRREVADYGPVEGAKYVDTEIRDMFSIVGSREEIVDRFEEIEKMGADEFVIGPPFSGDWRNALARIVEGTRTAGKR